MILKRTNLILMGIIGLSCLNAQVGINTKVPLNGSIFHIDGAGDNTSSVTVSTAQATNDILIDTQGRVGVGIIAPTAKLHIVAGGVFKAMRIADGTQGVDKILKSDANGYTSWINPPTTDGQIYNIMGGSTPTSFANGQHILLKAVPVANGGNFLVTIRWWGESSSVDAAGQTSAYFRVANSTTSSNNWGADGSKVQDAVQYYVTRPDQTKRFCFSTSLFARVEAGQFIKVYINVSVGGPWRIATASATNYLWNPSIIVYRI